MFYGGFNTNIDRAKPVAAPAVLLSTLGVIATAGITGVFAHFALGFDWIGGLLLGCTRSVASKFTFFLAIPVMFGASALKLVKYFIKGGTFGTNEIAILGVGCVVAFAVSLIAIKWLMGFVRRHDFKCFGVYRIILGIVVLAYFFVLEPMLGL